MNHAWRSVLLVALAATCALVVSARELGVAAVNEPTANAPAPAFRVELPPSVLAGTAFEISVFAEGDVPDGARLTIVDDAGRDVGHADWSGAGPLSIEVAGGRGRRALELRAPGLDAAPVSFSARSLPGWWTLVPPVIAILLALLFREVVPALLAGVWVGAWIYEGGPLVGALRTLDRYVVESMVDADKLTIIIFSLLLGGMVGIVSRSGGTIGLVESLAPFATSSRRGQLVTWFMGLAVFFDDYANTLLVGNTMRPVTDRLRISREKLAYIVDSTAAPVASIGLVSTWIGYEVSLIGDSLDAIGSDLDAYSVFLRSLPYNFYPLLALVFGLLIASSMRDFGPMLAAERRARGGAVLADGASPLADFDGEALCPPDGTPHRWVNAVLPVIAVLLVTFGWLWSSGRASLAADGDPLATTGLFSLGIQGLGGVFGAGDSYRALLYAATAGCVVATLLAVGQRILSIRESVAALVNGIRSMALAIMILVLAWGVSAVCHDLNTRGFMVAALTDLLDPRLLPTLIFALASVTAFATGTSWGTMGILIPLAVPTAVGVTAASGAGAGVSTAILLGSVSAVLAGAIFGDHCSPISDTTVLSSMASGCDHVDHVRTQLPYAVVVGLVAIVAGYVPAGFGISPFICLPLAIVMLVAIVRLLGREH